MTNLFCYTVYFSTGARIYSRILGMLFSLINLFPFALAQVLLINHHTSSAALTKTHHLNSRQNFGSPLYLPPSFKWKRKNLSRKLGITIHLLKIAGKKPQEVLSQLLGFKWTLFVPPSHWGICLRTKTDFPLLRTKISLLTDSAGSIQTCRRG